MFEIKKINKLLHIVDNDEKVVYTPPRFVKMSCRSELDELANELNKKGFRDIDSIKEWESRRKYYRINRE